LDEELDLPIQLDPWLCTPVLVLGVFSETSGAKAYQVEWSSIVNHFVIIASETQAGEN
jgi:hypothetical protein